jgi:hypothetical protein
MLDSTENTANVTSAPLSLSLCSHMQCGVPKKGHVCPYQPKLKRRPDEPPPETRNAAIQVEMDEVSSPTYQ